VAPDTLAAAALQRERNLADVAASAYLRRWDALVAAGRDAELAALLDAARAANRELMARINAPNTNR